MHKASSSATPLIISTATDTPCQKANKRSSPINLPWPTVGDYERVQLRGVGLSGAVAAIARATRPDPAGSVGVESGCRCPPVAALAVPHAGQPGDVVRRLRQHVLVLQTHRGLYRDGSRPQPRPTPSRKGQEIQQGQSECSWGFNVWRNCQEHIVVLPGAARRCIFVTLCQRRATPYGAGNCSHAKSDLLQITRTYANSGNPPQQNPGGR